MYSIRAHRGDTQSFPENTLAAFQSALDKGADGIELDIQLSRENKLVVHHDFYQGYPDNGDSSKLISESTYEELQRLDIGNGLKIPTLAEVFTLLGNKIFYELEIKGFDKSLITALVELVQQFDLMSKVEFTSSFFPDLYDIKTAAPEANTGYIYSPTKADSWQLPNYHLQRMLGIVERVPINVLHAPLTLWDPELIEHLHSRNQKVHSHLDTKEDMIKGYALGIDQITTNNLDLALEVKFESDKL